MVSGVGMELMLSFKAATMHASVTNREYSSAPGALMLIPWRLYCMALSLGLRAEAWTSGTSVNATMRCTFSMFTPLPAIMAMRSPALLVNLFSIGMPATADEAQPEVSTRRHPRSMICSRATSGSRHMSKALWNVISAAPASRIMLAIDFRSTSPPRGKHSCYDSIDTLHYTFLNVI